MSLKLGCEHAEILETEKVEKFVDWEEMAKDLEHASPLTIMDRALEEFGNDIAIAFRYFECLQVARLFRAK